MTNLNFVFKFRHMQTSHTQNSRVLVRGSQGRFTSSVRKNQNYTVNLNGSFRAKYQGLDAKGNQLWLVTTPTSTES